MSRVKGKWLACASLAVLAGALCGCSGGGGGNGPVTTSPGSRATGLGSAIAAASDRVPYREVAGQPLYEVSRTPGGGVTVLVAPNAAGESRYAPATMAVPDVGLEGWNGQVVEKAGEAVTEYVTFLTDMEEPSDELFRRRYTFEERTDVFGGPNRTARVNQRLLASPDFPESNIVHTYEEEGRFGTSFAGTFDGVSGLFECVAPDGVCRLSADGTGALRQDPHDRWQFIADAPNVATVKVPDPEFLYFGWWLEEPREAAPGGGFAYRFATLSGGSVPFVPDTMMAAVTGTATFTGPAAGRYVTRASGDGGAEAGTFTATAELKADFDAAGAGVLEGELANFRDQDANLLPWEIALSLAAIDGNGAVSGTATGRIGTDASGSGRWTAAFFGDGRDDGQPDAAAGEFGFDATSFGLAANIAGGFAVRQSE